MLQKGALFTPKFKFSAGVRVLAFLGLLGLGCGRGPSTFNLNNSCSSGQAQILVQDGFMKTLCGCSEGAVLRNSGNLTCTTNARQVMFIFQGSSLQHQIIPSSGSPISASGVISPNSPGAVHIVTLATSGTYGFVDVFTPGLSGTIIAL